MEKLVSDCHANRVQWPSMVAIAGLTVVVALIAAWIAWGVTVILL